MPPKLKALVAGATWHKSMRHGNQDPFNWMTRYEQILSLIHILKHKSTIFYEDWLTLYGQEADILVTHEAPTCHPHGFHGIDVLAQSMKAKFTFHGHHHDRLNYQDKEEALGFSAHGVGFRGVSDMYGGMISAGSYDEERAYRSHHD